MVTDAPPGSLSARCVAFTVSLLCNNISTFLFCPSIIDRTMAGLDTLRKANEYVSEDASLELSALGETFDSTPMVLPVRANLDRVKRPLKGGPVHRTWFASAIAQEKQMM